MSDKPASNSIRVLALDDEEAVCLFVKRVLTSAGFEVETALEGRAALQLLMQHDFDVLVVDVLMSGMSGIAFLQEALKIWPWLGVVMITGFSEESVLDEARKLGVSRILHKPVVSTELIRHVSEEASARKLSGKDDARLRIQYQLRVLRQLSESAIAARSLPEALKRLTAGVSQFLPCDVAGMLTVEEEARTLTLNVQNPVSPAFLDEVRRQTIQHYAALSGQKVPPETIEVLMEGSALDPAGTEPVGSVFMVPILLSDRIRGLLILASRRTDPYAHADMSFLYNAANHFSTLLVALGRMQQMAVQDPLTGLFNRVRLEESIENVWQMANRYKRPMSVLITDLDHFKKVNDLYGHPMGDQVLREFAQIIRQVTRGSDVISRYGGDEFVIVLPFGDLAAGHAVAERLLAAVREHIFCRNTNPLRMTASVGVASTGDESAASASDLLKDADRALYLAKNRGRNRACVWSSTVSTPVAPPAPAGAPAIIKGGDESPPGRILVVDDEDMVRTMLQRMIEMQGHQVVTHSSVVDALAELKAHRGTYDVVLTDLAMPEKSGIELLEEITTIDDSVVGVVMTGHATVDNAIASMRRGAYDFILKPFSSMQLNSVLKRALEYRRLTLENRRYRLYLEDMVREKSSALSEALNEIKQSYDFSLEAMVAMLDAREHATAQHSLNVRKMALILGRELDLSGSELEDLRHGALLHDIGKIGIPDGILLKAGPLTEEEWKIMRTHPEIGYRILRSSQYLARASEIVYSHQEQWDGSGYPRGLKGRDICTGARVFAVIDAYDALRSNRPYRKALGAAEARDEVVRNSGTQFDPDVVAAFESCHEKIEEAWAGQTAELPAPAGTDGSAP